MALLNGRVAKQGSSYWTASERKVWSIVLYTGLLLQFMSASAGPVTMVALAEEFRWDKASQGSILSSYFWGSGMMQLAGGWISDLYGGDNVLFFTSIAWVTMVLLTPLLVHASHDVLVSSATIYLLIRFVLGLLHGSSPGALASLLGRKLETRYMSSVTAFINSGACIGTVLIGLFGSLMLNYDYWPGVFYGIGLVGLVWLILWKVFLRSSHDIVIEVLPREIGEQLPATHPTKIPWKTILSHPPLWVMVIANLAVSICFNGLSTWLPMYFHDTFPESRTKGWIFNVIPWLVNSACAFVSGIWADNLCHRGFSITCVRKFFYILTLLGPALSLLMLRHVSSFVPALFLTTVAIGMTGFNNAAGNVIPQDVAPEYAGSVAGVANTVVTLAVFVAVYFAGYFLRVFDSWPFYFVILSCICTCGCLVFALFGSAKKIT